SRMSQGNDPPRRIVGRVADLPPGSSTIVPVGKFGVGVFNVRGSYHALINYCLHRGAPVCKGTVTGSAVPGNGAYESVGEREGEILRCRWHAWEFDIRTGRSLSFPERKIRTYPVAVEDGLVILEGFEPDAGA